jgi:hypothetical protein
LKTRYCLRCREEIPAERIEVLPDTRLCVKCVVAVGGEFEMRTSQENLGKAGSLKKNYGGVSVRKRRKRIEPVSEVGLEADERADITQPE